MVDAIRVHDPLDYWARLQPDAEFVVIDGVACTYGEAAVTVDRMAGALAHSLDPGRRVAILSRNSVEMLLLYYAASKAGVVPVPLNYRLAAPELEYILNDSAAGVVLAAPEYVAQIDALRSKCPAVRTIVAVGNVDFAGWLTWAQWLAHPIDERTALARRHDEAMQIYTSGTTGRPKGAVLTQTGLSNLLHQWRICFPFSPNRRMLVVAPLYHVGGTFHSMHAIGHGGSVFLYTDFDAGEVVRALDEEEIDTAFLVPAMIQSCLAVEDVDQRAFASFRQLSYGASPISEATLRRALDIWRCDFVQAFGMTECPCITYLSAADHRRALAGYPYLLESTGKAGPGSDLKIVGPDGQEVPPGQVGEILGRGPQMMSAYWNLPEATAEALSGGWMHTGDAGCIDAEGYLFVKDRIKDMIVSGGENIYPREIEDVLLAHPSVADAAVIGVPSEQWGESPLAFVVPHDGTDVQIADLAEFCREHLAGYKRPRAFEIVDVVPRNPSGKVLKRVLREPYWADRRRGVS
ncbi:long-chain-fatty-acid--CoA ligase [Mycolicibacterium moriokaense]|uniref:Long-chain-fatty-acid--CoA ligase FadD13 n=1 Tax=Mycolicibacterium moriokaense TaxID=39691 RepID=A0A318HBK0_9MYCO|nr:long-chain-fatty-acid--CoA ligase [Mycolicibacterium moriokaense]PXX01657.1 acyl-CoA synthetase (AMP-forming)/AMP-acid ligase II [Mycolicibacterium moriokaense]